VGKAHLQATSGRDLQVNPGIAVQLQKVELLYQLHAVADAQSYATRDSQGRREINVFNPVTP
jgi:hypothetical protein